MSHRFTLHKKLSSESLFKAFNGVHSYFFDSTDTLKGILNKFIAWYEVNENCFERDEVQYAV